MKRKFLFFAISILTFLGVFLCSNVSVSAITDYGSYVWSFEDLLNGTGEAWNRPECQSDPFSGNPCIEASMQFSSPSSTPFYITSIDPTNSKIKIFFKTESSDYLKLYLYWSDNPATLFDIIDIDDYSNAHDLFYEESNNLSAGLLQPWREIELTISNGHLLSQSPYDIYYVFNDSMGSFPQGGLAASYSTCMTELQPGMECHLRFDDYMNQLYVATNPSTANSNTTESEAQDNSPEQPAQSDSNEVNPEPGEANSDPSETGSDFDPNEVAQDTETTINDSGYGSSDDAQGYVTDTDNTGSIYTATEASAATGITPKTTITPDTGANTVPQKEGTNEFPFWLGAIFAIGVITLVWLFWPIRRKKSKKI